MVSGYDALGYFFGYHCCADGEAVSERFGRGEDVGMGVGEVLVGPEVPGAGEPALDFVVDEDGADVVAAGAEGAEERRRRYVDAAFALDGLDDDAAGFGGDEVAKAGLVVVGAVDEAGDHGAEGGLVFRVRGRG